MSRDSDWVQREMRLMSDAKRDAYIKRSRDMYDRTMRRREIYAKYKPEIDKLIKQRQKELDLLEESDKV
jgi:hypothetical protein